MRIRIENLGGRHLGTYEAENEAAALTAYVQENHYVTIDEAEAKRFINCERLAFFEET